MQRLLWRLRPLHLAATWPFVLAIVLLVASALVYLQRVLPKEAEIAALDTEIDRLRHADARPVAEDSPLAPGEQLAVFYAFFPAEDTQSDILDRLFAAAARENLALPQGDYQWARERTGRLVRYSIMLPLKGSYPGIRRFMAQALRETPSLALDSVGFRRQTVNDIGVDAQVQFTLYMHGSTP